VEIISGEIIAYKLKEVNLFWFYSNTHAHFHVRNRTATTFQHSFTHIATATPTYVTDIKMHLMVKVTQKRGVAALIFNLSTKKAWVVTFMIQQHYFWW